MSYPKTRGPIVGIIEASAGDDSDRYYEDSRAFRDSFRHFERKIYKEVHQFVDSGLAISETQIAQEKPPNVFTTHGTVHIRRLIENLDDMVEAIQRDTNTQLEPLEAYILLCAAHFHDAANVEKRENHPERCDEFIQKYRELLHGGTPVITSIYQVASVHGGTHRLYGKDTFRGIDTDNTEPPRLPLLAALLRLADELAEHPDRVQEVVVERHPTSDESILANNYARSFASFKFRKENLKIVYNLWPFQLAVTGIHDGKDCTFLDYLEAKIDALEREARYCSQYGRPYLTVSRIDILINEFEKEHSNKIAGDPKKFSLNLNFGYPQTLSKPLCERSKQLKDLNIANLRELFPSATAPDPQTPPSVA